MTLDSSVTNSETPRRRKIGRWFLGETLGKGGYSWVKKGYDRKTGQAVALKFMDKKKASESWQETQTRQVRTEIEALKQIQHPNILRLLAYNLNARYPERNGVNRNVILLVLEYMPGGELFDILYYSAQLEENVARTYFRQLIDGIEACHLTGICHRDIKPQNLLLNEYYQLKITDFGLAKIFEEKEEEMHSFHVGTRGYQAPEILERQPYTPACDLFSAGVVLFILLTGYPPFEHAKASDKWYRPLTRGSPKRFWKNHHGCGVGGAAKDLITRMFACDPARRVTIADIRNHPWYNQAVLPMEKLAEALRLRHRMMEVQRRNDPRKQMVLQGSNDIRQKVPVTEPREKTVVRGADGAEHAPEALQLSFPRAPYISTRSGAGLNSYYTRSHHTVVLGHLRWVIEDTMQGQVDEHDNEEARMTARVSIADDKGELMIVSLAVRVFKADSMESDYNVVKFTRLEGSFFAYRRVTRSLVDFGYKVLSGVDDEEHEAMKLNDAEGALLDQIFPNWKVDLHAEEDPAAEQADAQVSE